MPLFRLTARAVFLSASCFLLWLPVHARDIPAASGSIRGQAKDGSVYTIQSGIDGEIYPVFANYASLQHRDQRRFGVVSVTISNPATTPLRQTVSVQIPGWSDQEVQVAEVSAGATRTFIFAPSFLARFYENREIMAATANVSAEDGAGRIAYQTTIPVRLRSCEDIYWGDSFEYARFIASWVTPHDALVESLLARAKQFTADQRPWL